MFYIKITCRPSQFLTSLKPHGAISKNSMICNVSRKPVLTTGLMEFKDCGMIDKSIFGSIHPVVFEYNLHTQEH